MANEVSSRGAVDFVTSSKPSLAHLTLEFPMLTFLYRMEYALAGGPRPFNPNGDRILNC